MDNTKMRQAALGGIIALSALVLLAGNAGVLLKLDSFNLVLVGVFSVLAFAQVLTVPNTQLSSAMMFSVFALHLGTLMVYCSDSMASLILGWTLSAAPMIWWRNEEGERWGLPAIALVLSLVALIAAVVFVPMAGMHGLAFGAFTLALVFRKGIFPAQSWVPAAFEKKPIWLANLTVNSHLGAVLAVRVAIPMLAVESRGFTQLASALALMTAIGSALAALREDRPRRLLAWVFSSQAAIILAGLESANAEGISGAFVHMIVVSVAATAMFLVYQGIEARFGAKLSAEKYSGLAARTPRLAAFFIISGLALVGLPGTLGFCAEDLLLQGTLHSHPLLGVILPLATALNGWNIFRVYSRVFLGKGPRAVPVVADALPRERWALAAMAVALVWGGIFPQGIVNSRAQAAGVVAGLLNPPAKPASLR